MIDLINLKKDRLDDIVSDKLEIRVAEMVHNVLLTTCEEIVNNDDSVSSGHQTVHEMRSNESSTTGDDDS